MESCAICNGTGRYKNKGECYACKGSGRAAYLSLEPNYVYFNGYKYEPGNVIYYFDSKGRKREGRIVELYNIKKRGRFASWIELNLIWMDIQNADTKQRYSVNQPLWKSVLNRKT